MSWTRANEGLIEMGGQQPARNSTMWRGTSSAAAWLTNVKPLHRADMILADQSYQGLHACPAS